MREVLEDTQRKIKFLFRCDVGTKNEVGTGHLIRSVALAKKLNQDNNLKNENTIFLTSYEKKFSFVENILRKNNFKLQYINLKKAPPNSNEEFEIIKKINPQIIIFDRIKTNKSFISKFQKYKFKTVLLDDIGSAISHANLVICPIFFDRPLNKKIYKGFKYMIFSEIKRKKKNLKKNIFTITVSFGGYDKRKLFFFLMKNFHKIDSKYRFNLIFGFEKEKVNSQILKYISKFENINTFFRPKNYSDILFKTDLAIISGGLTLIEFLSIGVPTIALPQYKHQYSTIKILENLGCTIMGSKQYKLNWVFFFKIFNNLINNYKLRKNMSIKGKKIIDSNGKERVSKLISKLL